MSSRKQNNDIKEKRMSDVSSESFRLTDNSLDREGQITMTNDFTRPQKVHYPDDDDDYNNNYDVPQRTIFPSRVGRTLTRIRPVLGVTGDSLFPKQYDAVIINRPVLDHNKFNELYEENITTGQTMRFLDNIFMPKKESRKCLDIILGIFPLINVLRHYKIKSYLPFDILSGLTTGVMRIPQSMAYSILAHLPPQYGLYTAFYSGILYPIFGGSPHMVTGSGGVVALIIGGGVTQYASKISMNATGHAVPVNSNAKVQVAITITFMIGVIQCLLGVFRFGFVTNYLSAPLIAGFTTACAVCVVVTQLPLLLGIHIHMYTDYLNFWYSLIDIFKNIPSTNVANVIIAIFCFVVLIVCKHLTTKYIKKIKLPIPGELIVVIIMVLFSHFLKIDTRWKVSLVGTIQEGFPEIRIPTPSLMLDTIGVAISGAIISFTIAYSVSKRLSYEHGYEIDGNQEVFAFGFLNLVGSFFSAMAGTGSLTAAALHESLGGVSQIANYVAALLIMLTFLCIGKLFEPIPQCVLSAIILVNLKPILFQFKDLKTLWRVSKFDFLLWIVTFLGVVIGDINLGLIIGVVLSLLTIVFRTQWPYTCALGRIPSTDIYKNVTLTPSAKEIPGIKIVRFEGSLYFASADHFRNAVKHVSGVNPSKTLKERKDFLKKMSKVKEEAINILGENIQGTSYSSINDNVQEFINEDVHHLIIDFSTCAFTDSVGIRTLLQLIKEFKAIGIIIFIANLKSGVRAMLMDSKVLDSSISSKHCFLSVHDAVLGALEDKRFIEERNYLITDASIKSNVRFLTRIASDTDLKSRLNHPTIFDKFI